MYTDEDVKFIREVLERNNFQVRVSVTEKGADYILLSVAYPNETKDVYKVAQTGIIELNGEVVYVNPGLSRLYIMLDIFKIMRENKLPLSIIECRDLGNNLVDRLDDLIPEVPDDKKDIELKVSKAVTEISNNRKLMNTFDKQMRADKIYTGFNTLKGLIV